MNDLNKIEYNTKQEQAIKILFDFINQHKEHFMFVFGYAGTGKTFLIMSLLSKILKLHIFDIVHICSPTHQTLDLLEALYYKITLNKDEIENIGKIKFSVIHSLLKMKPQISYKSGEKIFCRKDKKITNIPDNQTVPIIKQLVIIDECSMISKKMLLEIQNYSTENSAKILFLGDNAQLPPIGEKSSPVFNCFPKNYKYYILLDEIMRTKSNNIKKVCTIVRNNSNINDILKNVIPIFENKNNTSFMLYHRKSEYITSSWFKNFIKKKDDYPLILTWTNKAAIYYNTIIRSYIHNSDDISYKINDRLIVNKFYKSPLDNSIYYTSKFIKVLKVETIEEDVFKWNILKINNAKTVVDKFVNKLVIKLINLSKNLKVDYMTVAIINKCQSDSEQHLVKTINCYYIKNYKEILKLAEDHFVDFYKKYNSKLHLLNLWNHYHNQIIDTYIDLNFGYSITVHKAQGSTYNQVYVDVGNIVMNSEQGELIKCLYTAVSRPVTQLSLLI